MLVGVPTNHTLEALDGGHVWEVIPGSMDEEVGESEPKGRVSLRNTIKCSLMPPNCGSWNSVLLGLLRNCEDHASESPIQGQKVWGQLPSSVGCGVPLRALSPPSTTYVLLGCSRLQLGSFSQCQGKPSGRGEMQELEVGGCQRAGNCPSTAVVSELGPEDT